MNKDKVIELDYFPITSELNREIMLHCVLYPTYKEVIHARKLELLGKLGITVKEGEAPLTAWTLAMCRKNGLPEELPATAIGDAALEHCQQWIYFLA